MLTKTHHIFFVTFLPFRRITTPKNGQLFHCAPVADEVTGSQCPWFCIRDVGGSQTTDSRSTGSTRHFLIQPLGGRFFFRYGLTDVFNPPGQDEASMGFYEQAPATGDLASHGAKSISAI